MDASGFSVEKKWGYVNPFCVVLQDHNAGDDDFSHYGGGADEGPLEVDGLLCLCDCNFEETAVGDALLDVRLVLVIIDAHDFSLCCAVVQSSCEVELVAKEVRTSGWPIGEEDESSAKEDKWGSWQLIA